MNETWIGLKIGIYWHQFTNDCIKYYEETGTIKWKNFEDWLYDYCFLEVEV